MHTSYKSFNRKRQQAASERGRKMANVRWKLDRERRDARRKLKSILTSC